MEFIGLALLCVLYIFVMAFLGVLIVALGFGLLELVAVRIPRWLNSVSQSPRK